mmetsp:Transcript_39180/g.61065  ORF Transcript_39180/g.61065 Transcript_39180/m.61065 type:complete len:106 (+) Transcript_39180:652-969(+)
MHMGFGVEGSRVSEVSVAEPAVLRKLGDESEDERARTSQGLKGLGTHGPGGSRSHGANGSGVLELSGTEAADLKLLDSEIVELQKSLDRAALWLNKDTGNEGPRG